MPKSTRPLVGTFVDFRKMVRWQRQDRVVTVCPDARHCTQAGSLSVLREARQDGTIIAPHNLPEDYSLRFKMVNIGQLFLPERKGFKAERVTVQVSETNPALVLLQNSRYLSKTLYGTDEKGKVVESEETILKRVAFFNRAVAALIREAEIDPKILHVVDWPTALCLLYLEESNIYAPQVLFTYPDARFQGLFDEKLLPFLGLTGQRPTDLKYLNQLSLAQIGLLRAQRITTWLRSHLQEVIEGKRSDGGDFGLFQGIFQRRHKDGEIYFLYTEPLFARRVGLIDMLSPRPRDQDYIFGTLLRYSSMYTLMVPEVDLARMPETTLYTAAERIDLSPYVRYAKVIKELEDQGLKDVLPAVKALIKGFGSKAALRILSEGTQEQKAAFLQSLRELPLNWYDYARIARNALFGIPRKLEQVEALETQRILSAPAEVKQKGMEALRGKPQQSFGDLLIFTMSGGLGNRLRFSVQVSSDVVVDESQLQEGEIKQLYKLEEAKKANLRFESPAGPAWVIPQEYVPEAGFLSRFEVAQGTRTVKIPRQILSAEANGFLIERGFLSARDGKLDDTWFIPLQDFQSVLPEIQKRSDEFVNNLLDQTAESASKEGVIFINIPKGVYQLPGTGISLYKMQARSLARLEAGLGKKILWGIMTGQENDRGVRQYLASHLKDGKYFGVFNSEQVEIDAQANNPVVAAEGQKIDIVVDPQTGKIIVEAKGHGGFHDSADRVLKKIKSRLKFEPRWVLGCNIENVLFNEQLGSLDFMAGWLGWHVTGTEGEPFDITGLAAKKSGPREPMGIFARAERVAQVIEYSHPNFTVLEAYAYLTSHGRVYFVKDKSGTILLASPKGLTRIFGEDAPPGSSNVSQEKKNLKPGYELLDLADLNPDQRLFFTDDELHPTGQSVTLSDLGEIELEYRQGNTNIFIFNSELIRMVTANPSIMAREEHKLGSHRQGRKIESSIFGPLSLVRDFESSLAIPVINIGFVEEERGLCFEPVKSPEDVQKAQAALAALLAQYPQLDLR